MHSVFSTADKEIIDMFLGVDYPWKSDLLCQLHNSNYMTEAYENAYYITFTVDPSCRSISNIPRVPLAILLEFGCLDNTVEIHYDNTCISFESTSPSPIGCNMHIANGYLSEIEVYTLDGTSLELKNLCKGKRHYLFNSSNWDT